MTEHVRIIGAAITLILGVFVAARVYWIWKSFSIGYLKEIFVYVVCFNLGIGLLLTIKYLDLNLSSDLSEGVLSALKTGGIVGGLLCLFGMAWSVLSTTFQFLGKRLPFWAQTWLVSAYFVVGSSIISYTVLFPEIHYSDWLQYLIVIAGGSVVALECGSLIVLFAHAKKLRHASRIRTVRAFAILFLFRYFLFLSLLSVLLLVDSDWLIPVAVYLVLVLNNVIPLEWVILLRRDMTSLASHEVLPAVLESLGTEYGISRREHEVLSLILRGNSNKEIEAELFISGHTVKNHIYNLYQKLGVKSRYQLINLLFSRYPGEVSPNKKVD